MNKKNHLDLAFSTFNCNLAKTISAWNVLIVKNLFHPLDTTLSEVNKINWNSDEPCKMWGES